MDFRLSLEQEMLRDSARRYISTEHSFEKRAKHARDPAHDSWSELVELGWLALGVPEDNGGIGSSVEDLAILSEEMGRGLFIESFIGCAVLPTRLLSYCPGTAQREAALEAIATGDARIAVALYESGRRYALAHPVTEAKCNEDGTYRLSGSKIAVCGAAGAKRIIVSASIEAGEPALFLIDADAAGIERRAYAAIDDERMCDLTLREVHAREEDLLVRGEVAGVAVEHATDDAIVCLCADILGGMEKAVELTAEYLKIRMQFGRPLAEFQALQHATAEMFIETSNARSILYRAIAALSGNAQERRKAISACKVKVMSSAKSVIGMAVHLHGGIGVTCEYPVGHYLRRVLVAERLFGDNEYHIERYIGQGTLDSNQDRSLRAA